MDRSGGVRQAARGKSGTLLAQHARVLVDRAVADDVARERGYRSADTKAHLAKLGFVPTQQRPPALLIPWHGAGGGVVDYSIRPDDPRVIRDKAVKYDWPRGHAQRLDVHPRCLPHARDPSVPLWVTESPLKADALISAGAPCVVGLPGVWPPKDGPLPDWDDIALDGRRVLLAFDSDVVTNPNVHQAAERYLRYLTNRGAKLEVVHLPPGDQKMGVDDFLADNHTLSEVEALAEPGLRPLELPGAEQLSFEHVADEPLWMVLDDLREWLTAHVDFVSEHDSVAITLWAAHSHLLARASATPRLVLESPEPESGKTRTLELLEMVTRAGLLALQMSPAALYRVVDARRPTVLLDEIDAVFGPKASKDHEDLRALVNAGHRPGATVPRVDMGPPTRVVEFNCFCPVALAGLAGSVPNTIRSRAIRIQMRRRAPDVTVRHFRERITRPEGEALRTRLAAWCERHAAEVAEDPVLPPGVTDRQADQWEPLVAVADAAGPDWAKVARETCVRFVTDARGDTDDQSLGVRLLADVRTVFGDADRLTTADLLQKLHGLEEAPWSDLRGNPITARWLAQKLKPYGIKPRDHRFNADRILKGYLVTDFHDVWTRYLKGNMGNKGNVPARSVAQVAHVADNGQGENPGNNGAAASTDGEQQVPDSFTCDADRGGLET